MSARETALGSTCFGTCGSGLVAAAASPRQRRASLLHCCGCATWLEWTHFPKRKSLPRPDAPAAFLRSCCARQWWWANRWVLREVAPSTQRTKSGGMGTCGCRPFETRRRIALFPFAGFGGRGLKRFGPRCSCPALKGSSRRD